MEAHWHYFCFGFHKPVQLKTAFWQSRIYLNSNWIHPVKNGANEDVEGSGENVIIQQNYFCQEWQAKQGLDLIL